MRHFNHYMLTQKTLGVGEQTYGLGERCSAFNKAGQRIVLRNADCGTSSEQAYKNVSFWLSNGGFGIFIDTPEWVRTLKAEAFSLIYSAVPSPLCLHHV